MAKVLVRDRNKNKVDKKPNWEYRFEAAKVGGKRKHISKAGFRTQKEAYAAGVIAYNEYHNGGGLPVKQEMSFSDYLDEWVEKYVNVNLRHKTQSSYIGIINNHIKPALGHYKLMTITAAQLQVFANSLKDKGFSHRHLINTMSIINNALNYAIEPLQYIKENPARLIRMPKIDRPARERIVLQPDNWRRIISRFPFGNKYHIPLIIGYHTGMRISEVFALTWSDIDFANGEIYVEKQIVKIKHGKEKAKWCFGKTKTEASVRTVKIGETLLKILKQEKIRQNQNRLLYGEYYTHYLAEIMTDENTLEIKQHPKGNLNLICVNDDGTFVTTDSFKYCSRVIHHELNIEFDFHSLRHTHATILIENGADIKNVQKRLGHEKIETTLQTYVHDTERMAERSVDIFEKAIGGQV